MAEPIALHVIVLNLADPLHPQRLPGQILAGAPAALYARHAVSFPSYTHPITPRMIFMAFLRSGASSFASWRRIVIVNDEVTPTCCRTFRSL